ncbi:putative ADP-ribosylation factor GTPase-activating protein AGD14 isoform X3 [Canna indica]|uniref:ADP-ribosylation factor GTPase-activating protein AGD14 isoform X3 n=1 Tax=Canna indica TaxID=4628 RepID=A0AAQ3K9A0_9LILI|nr:putative ADP-ribosylation factor GTPase-activating protein AGD14 isoform X3 [Canna indica]
MKRSCLSLIIWHHHSAFYIHETVATDFQRIYKIHDKLYIGLSGHALQKGGNQLAREIFLKDSDMQWMRFPDSSICV